MGFYQNAKIRNKNEKSKEKQKNRHSINEMTVHYY